MSELRKIVLKVELKNTIITNMDCTDSLPKLDKPEHTDHLNPEKSPQRLNVESGRFY